MSLAGLARSRYLTYLDTSTSLEYLETMANGFLIPTGFHNVNPERETLT